jgi:hypothetical protein
LRQTHANISILFVVYLMMLSAAQAFNVAYYDGLAMARKEAVVT